MLLNTWIFLAHFIAGQTLKLQALFYIADWYKTLVLCLGLFRCFESVYFLHLTYLILSRGISVLSSQFMNRAGYFPGKHLALSPPKDSMFPKRSTAVLLVLLALMLLSEMTHEKSGKYVAIL